MENLKKVFSTNLNMTMNRKPIFATSEPDASEKIKDEATKHIEKFLAKLGSKFRADDATDSGTEGRVRLPKLSVVDIHSSTALFGVVERTVAIESLVSLMNAYTRLRPALKTLLPPNIHEQLDVFYRDTVDECMNLRRHMYKHMSAFLMNMDPIVEMIANCKWDLKEISTDTNNYVTRILDEFKMLHDLLEALSQKGCMPDDVKDMLWSIIIANTMEFVVEGLSRVKKCNNEGRAMMAMDFRYLQIGLEKYTRVRPIPKKEYVENYIRGYYLPEKDFLAWVQKNRTEYTLQQMENLANIGVCANMKRKEKGDFLAKLKDTKLSAPLESNAAL
eukprot:TRINITY_DN4484_c0_g1::TRINITY_DN4484_c0_g1_i1::g.7335::m.7335 TRINITY_DN4484_c0_g1::TRINITY_DN4484_c0_g1_i1::g.7335  ORF type:complete len:345 (-),score=89.19,sp/Q96JG6/VPS50_HUMAN/37.59/4e-48,DUF2451/PF10474.4/2e-64,DUF1664/PF07889.7/2.9e+02,DUF1664/PF07889.7/0.92 TRINITY_DN4484_c0_g1_i1:107-1102(-)